MDGSSTSAIVVARSSANWTAGFVAACVACCVGGRNGVEGHAEQTTNVGPIAFFDEHGLWSCKPPIFVLYNPHRGNTINWRAGCVMLRAGLCCQTDATAQDNGVAARDFKT